MLSLTAVALVFAGGFCGGAARYALTRLVRDARAATFAANIAASMIIGFVAAAPDAWQTGLGVGFAGALSTWSTFARELGELMKAGRRGEAARHALYTALLGITGAWFGLAWGGRAFG